MIITRAPLRVSFFGGGTDYPEYFREHGGAVLATAIDSFTYVTASYFHSPLFDYRIRLSYRENELVRTTGEIRHSVFRACLELLELDRDIELHTVADLPSFTGLGSSSSFTVALLQALHAFRGTFRSAESLAREAIQVERVILREAVGCQDQVLAAFGGFQLVEFHGEQDFTVRRVPIARSRLDEFQGHFLLVYTGIKRRASEHAARQVAKVGLNVARLGQMQAMAYRGHEILATGRPFEEIGGLLHEAWQAKKQLDDQISPPEVDDLYERGLRAGALGGKLLGAGGGGFVLFFVPPAVRAHFLAEFRDAHVLEPRMGAPGSSVIFA